MGTGEDGGTEPQGQSHLMNKKSSSSEIGESREAGEARGLGGWLSRDSSEPQLNWSGSEGMLRRRLDCWVGLLVCMS